MSVNIRKDGRLKKVAGLLPGSLATFDKDQFELVGAEKKFSLKEWLVNKINKIDDIYEGGFASNNVLKTTLESGNKNNITYTRNADGTYTLNTTSSGASANTWLVFAEKVPLKGGSYKVLGKTTWGTPYAQFFDASGTNISNDVTNGNTFSSNDIASVSYIIAVGNGIALDNVVIKPFITTKLDATIDDFTPYAENNVELTEKLSDNADWLKSKNVFPLRMPTNSGSFSTIYNYIVVKPNTTYTFSTNIPRNESGYAEIFIASGKVTTVTTGGNGAWNGNPRTVTSDAEGYLTVAYQSISGIVLSNYYYQLEEGTEVTPYQPFSESNVALTTKLSDAETRGYTPTKNHYCGIANTLFEFKVPKGTCFIASCITTKTDATIEVYDENKTRLDYWYMSPVYNGRKYKTIIFNTADVYYAKFTNVSDATDIQLEIVPNGTASSKPSDYAQPSGKSNVQLTEDIFNIASKLIVEMATTDANVYADKMGVFAFLVTNGAKNIPVASDGVIFHIRVRDDAMFEIFFGGWNDNSMYYRRKWGKTMADWHKITSV